MTYKILPTKEFANDFRKIKDAKAKQAIINKIEEAAENPERYKRLHYELSGSHRFARYEIQDYLQHRQEEKGNVFREDCFWSQVLGWGG